MSPSQCPSDQLLSAYCDGELSDADRLQVDDHLAACASCARQAETFRRISGLIGTIESPEITQDGLDRIFRSATQTPAVEKSPRILGIGIFMLATAASILIICSAWLMELPARTPSLIAARHQTQPAAWELAAVNMPVPPTPDQGQTHLASDTRVTNIMLQQLENRDIYNSLNP